MKTNYGESTSKPQTEQNSIASQELLNKVAEYFHMLDNLDAALTQEQAEAQAGKYFAENIAGKYSPTEINIAIGITR